MGKPFEANMFNCKKCGKKIKNDSKICKYCGYKYKDSHKQLIKQSKNNIPKVSQKQFKNINLQNCAEFKSLPEFSNIDNIIRVAPALYDLLKSKLSPKIVKGVIINEELQKQINSGALKFMQNDKECFAILTKNGKIFKQLPLKDIKLPTLNFTYFIIVISINLLISEVRKLNKGIDEIKIHLENDRIAALENYINNLEKALNCKDKKRRNDRLGLIVHDIGIPIGQIKKYLQFKLSKKNDIESNEIFECLKHITIGYYTKARAYYYLCERENMFSTLKDFTNTLEELNCNHRDVLLKYNSQNCTKNFYYNEQIINMIDTLKQYAELYNNGKLLLEENKKVKCRKCGREIPSYSKKQICECCASGNFKKEFLKNCAVIAGGLVSGFCIPAIIPAMIVGGCVGATINVAMEGIIDSSSKK